VGGNPELVTHEETGLLFERGDASSLAAELRRLIEDEDLRRKLASNGQSYIRENFSAQVAAERMGDIYARLLRKQPPAG
jgi:glycosyltransferase involved in cell wall biosynthesis